MQYISGERVLDQATLDEQARRAASGFAAMGVGEGDGVGLLLVNEIEFLVGVQALGYLGAYPVPINWHSTGEEIAYIVADAGLRALVVHDRFAPAADRVLPEDVPLIVVPVPAATAAALRLPGPFPPADRDHHRWEEWLDRQEEWPKAALTARPAVIYTSGTTGKPKGVVREPHASDEARHAQATSLEKVWGATPGMRMLLIAPLYHSAPSAYTRAAMTTGGPDGRIYFLARFDAEEVLRMIDREHISHLWMVPTMFVKLLQLSESVRGRYDVSSLRNIVHSGAPCPVGVKEQMIEWFGPVINEFYGSTEVGPVAYATSSDWLSRPGTVGQVLPGCRVAVLDDQGDVLPPGRIGEIAAVNTTYSHFTYRNRQTDRDALDADGLILTGDIGELDDDGFLYLRDRRTDMVISGGVNLYPAEVEDVLLQLPNIRDGAAFGLPDPVFGERMVAAVALQNPEPDAAGRIIAALRERLASTKVPQEVFVLDEFPRADTGKVAKKKLRDLIV